MKVLFLGGDQRQIEMIRIMKNKGHDVSIVGFDQVMQSFVGVRKVSKKELDYSIYDIIILPTSGLRSDGSIKSMFSSNKIILTKDDFNRMKDNVKIFSGISTKKLKDLVAKSNKTFSCIFDLDDVSIYNSIPTVEGTLMMVIENTDYTIHDATIFIFGFGRVGITLSRVLKGMGAKVSVVTADDIEYARIFEMGLKPIKLSEVGNTIKDAQIVINTIPVLVLKQDLIKEMHEDALILDLATKPGGVDFESAKNRGIKAILAPGLPGLVAPKTAGKIYANAILRELEKCTKLDLD